MQAQREQGKDTMPLLPFILIVFGFASELYFLVGIGGMWGILQISGMDRPLFDRLLLELRGLGLNDVMDRYLPKPSDKRMLASGEEKVRKRPLRAGRVMDDLDTAVSSQKESSLPSVLDVLKQEVAILVVGAKGTGKTTLLRWLVHGRESILVLDPKNAPGKWPAHAKSLGGGLDFETINEWLLKVTALMKHRYELVNQGKAELGKFDPLVVVIDEGYAVLSSAPDAPTCFKSLLTLAREANIEMIIANHSSLVKPMGMSGEGTLREGLAQVHLIEVQGKRSATVDYGEGPQGAALPGPYLHRFGTGSTGTQNQYQTGSTRGEPANEADPVPVPGELTGPEDRAIYKYLVAGWSANAIHGKLGGNRADMLARVREIKSMMENSNE